MSSNDTRAAIRIIGKTEQEKKILAAARYKNPAVGAGSTRKVRLVGSETEGSTDPAKTIQGKRYVPFKWSRARRRQNAVRTRLRYGVTTACCK